MRRTMVMSVVGALSLLSVAWTPSAAAQTTAGLWHMDERSGGIASDDSGNANDGMLKDIAFVSPGDDGTPGAYGFNGTSSKVLVPNAASLNPGADNITVEVHVSFTVIPPAKVGDYDLMRKGTSNYYKVEIVGNGRARCQFHGTRSGAGLVFGPVLADGRWHTISCTKTATLIRGTVDGTASATKNVAVGTITNSVPLSLGGKADGTQDLYNGSMDEVSITIG